MGGNIGGEAAIMARFRCAASRLPGPRAASRVYRSAPVGQVRDQPDFLNVVVMITTAALPHDVLRSLQDIETALGRDRRRELRWGPRAIDLDLLVMDSLVIDSDTLTLPHPRMTERAFVLRPLAELVGEDFAIPGTHTTVGECLARLEVAAQVTKVITPEALPV